MSSELDHPEGADQAWARGPLDALAHALGHFETDGDRDRRHALVAFDQALEGVVTAYLHVGPGREDTLAPAARAREPRATFWPKAKYVIRLATQRGRPFPVTHDDVDLVHSFRNELQHGGGWAVPSAALVAAARDATVAAFETLGVDVSGATTGAAGRVRRAASRPAGLTEAAYLHAAAAAVPPGDRRPLVVAAYALAREMDPNAEGLHVRHLAERLVERGAVINGDPARTLYDALNRAHLNFDHLPPSIFRWKEPEQRDPSEGVRGKVLADAAYAFMVANDPERRGLRLASEVLTGLRSWKIPVRGTDAGATLNEAVRRDGRFERVSTGTYRWLAMEDHP